MQEQDYRTVSNLHFERWTCALLGICSPHSVTKRYETYMYCQQKLCHSVQVADFL